MKCCLSAPLLFVAVAPFLARPPAAFATSANVREETFHSAHLSREMPFRIYLPGGYDDPGNAARRYPVLFLLHGHEAEENYESHTLWTENTGVADAADSYSMIIVFPEGLNSWYTDYYTSTPGHDEFERYVVDDLIPFIDASYRTGATRETRAIGGNSMGGCGAFKLALLHPDLFCSVFSLSGIVNLDIIGIGSYFEWLVGSNLGTVFGPYARNEILYRGNDPLLLAPTFVDWTRNSGSHMRIALRAGILDWYLTQVMGSQMDEVLAGLGVPHEFEIDPGDIETAGHTWTYWDLHVDEMLRFTWEAFRHPPERPRAWSYRTVEPAFRVWGYSFSFERQEWAWLVLDGVAAGGFRVSGEGAAGELAVRTPGIYEPGRAYRITSVRADPPASESIDARADSAGSLSFGLRLGTDGGAAADHEVRIQPKVGGAGGGSCGAVKGAGKEPVGAAAVLFGAVIPLLAAATRKARRRGLARHTN